ncbi:MAG: hypothetical protein K5842_06820 [Bacteroidales bacterium]|nr:hypothetical protein [Bacteroidales bacterium]
MTIMYIHGYGSDGNAMKGQLLRKMLPQHRVVSPTFDYNHETPWTIQKQISDTVEKEDVRMIVGSSFGGYHTLCATAFFHGTVWVVNPVHDIETTIRRIFINSQSPLSSHFDVDFLDIYKDFNARIFYSQVQLNQSGRWPDDTSLNFALSTDDELLGDHKPLLSLFPNHSRVVWKDDCGHRFLRFEELDILS